MPARCSAPKCHSCYDREEPIPIIKMKDEFSDEEKDQWRKFSHRAYGFSLKHVFLYAEYFQPWEVIYTCEALQPDDWIYVVGFEWFISMLSCFGLLAGVTFGTRYFL